MPAALQMARNDRRILPASMGPPRLGGAMGSRTQTSCMPSACSAVGGGVGQVGLLKVTQDDYRLLYFLAVSAGLAHVHVAIHAPIEPPPTQHAKLYLISALPASAVALPGKSLG
jgi:hypothetical protein